MALVINQKLIGPEHIVNSMNTLYNVSLDVLQEMLNEYISEVVS